MIPELLWIIGSYAAAALFVHWTVRREWSGIRRHYVLVAGNHQMQIEGYVRALQHYSRRTGTEIGITVVLDQSTDETKDIIERFARMEDGIDWVRPEQREEESGIERWMIEHFSEAEQGLRGSKEQVVWLELARREDVAQLPR